MATPPSEKPTRKFPAPCWTQDEALALIEAYKDRWYALRRGYLRTADWDAVAAAVADRCPGATPPKTSAQCRHKMEKLRQRYRAEKQRSLSFPAGRFFSSWFFFDNMDSMAVGSDGSTPEAGDNGNNRADSNSILRIKTSSKKVDGNSNSNPNFGQILGKNDSRVLNGYSPYVDVGSDEDGGEDTDFDAKLVPSVFRAKKGEKAHRNFVPNFDSNHEEGDFDDDGGGFMVKNPGGQHPGFRPKKFGKVDGMLNPNFECGDGGFFVKVSGDRYSVPKGFRTKSFGKNDGNSGPNNPDPRFMNGFSSNSGLGMGKKGSGGGRGGKRERDPIAEMVSSIKLLGEGFVKMEKMKMEMAREIEKTRMEMDMKRNEMILESQRQIVDAFANVLMEKKKKKENRPSTPVLPEVEMD